MNDLKMHICPTCGGKLNVNTKRQMYECPYCGVTFDYDYFREESVLDIAAQSLKNNEFTSADRAYDFLLEKEPDNFEALRGKALIAMNIPKIDDIRRIDLYPKLKYEPVCKEIDRAIESSKPNDREYFTVMKDIVDSGHEYCDEKAQLETNKAERDNKLHRLYEFYREKDTLCIYSSSKLSLKKAVILTVVCYIIVGLLIFLGFKSANRNPYSKAEDLSIYETEQTETSYNSLGINNTDSFENINAIANHMEYQKALEREEQRKIKYEEWENNSRQYLTTNLIFLLSSYTVIFALIVFGLIMYGRYVDSVISKIKDQVDEHADKIKKREEKMDEIKGRIDQDYNRLCELHPVSE